MIKVIWAADRVPGFSDEEFYGWWKNVHGRQEFNTTQVRRYVQHHTLAEARQENAGVKPTRDGASVGWYDDLDQMRDSYANVDRTSWTQTRFQHPMDIVIATERVIVDGETKPEMVKLLAIAKRNPALSIEEFQSRWHDEHAARWSKVPGLRRYVQNHGLLEAYGNDLRPLSHDGWSEEWFDDLDALKNALGSEEAAEARKHAADLFARPLSIVVARENPIVT